MGSATSDGSLPGIQSSGAKRKGPYLIIYCKETIEEIWQKRIKITCKHTSKHFLYVYFKEDAFKIYKIMYKNNLCISSAAIYTWSLKRFSSYH